MSGARKIGFWTDTKNTCGMVPARILVLTQKEMGDLIVITPLLRALKRRFPGHQIWVGSRPLIREVYANNPAVSGFIDVPLSEVKRGSFGGRLRAFFRSALRVRALKPEMVLQLETNDVMALWSFFSGAKRRVGIRRQTFGRLFNLHNALQEGGQSALLFYLGFLDALGEEADGFRTELFAAEKKVPARPPVVFIHPGARLAERLWPAACWVELIALIRKQYPQVKIRIARSRFDAAVCAELSALVPRPWHCEWREIHDFAGLCAATADASLALTLDSAPRHVAAAYDIPTVSLLAHWIVKDWGIYDDARHGVVLSHTARPDYGIHTIPVAAVFAEFVKRFGKSGRRRKK